MPNPFAQSFASIEDSAQCARTRTLVDTLFLAACVTTYKPAALGAGYGPDHQRDPNFHRHLGLTMMEDHAAGLPFRCSLVTNYKSGIPGAQYFEMARSLGYNIPMGIPAERAFWEDQIRKLGQNPAQLRLV
ncbi:MAG: hypothetical protein WDO74_04700 [Pseudomonadota bacterium]